MKKSTANVDKLDMWQRRYGRARSVYDATIRKMETREKIYAGTNKIEQRSKKQRVTETPHVRNLAAEMIDSQVSSSIPYPKVTARRKKDEHLARVIEDMLRNEIERLPFAELNDMASRTVPIQGGGYYLVEWDPGESTQTTRGDVTVSFCHPKKIIPQNGVLSSVEDMDYIFVATSETCANIAAKYGVDVRDESETSPEVRGDLDTSPADDLVTMVVAYYRNKRGGIGMYAWAGDTEVMDLEDYQAPRRRRCAVCGAEEPADALISTEPTADGVPSGVHANHEPGACPYCGSKKWEDEAREYEEIWEEQRRSDGSTIPGAQIVPMPTYENGIMDISFEEKPTRIPCYKPDIYPLILQRNVSVFGQLLGDSDIDRIADQQRTTNRLEAAVVQKVLDSGSILVLPPKASLEVNDLNMRVVNFASPAEAEYIKVLTLQGDISQDVAMLGQVYEEARQIIGITDSYQGRRDTTATSGTAKEFSAAQAAGRFESKRAMKDAAYAKIFEAMFKFKLAYSFEPRAVVARDPNGTPRYEEFNRWDFLERDAAGEWYWNDNFLFSVDASATLAANRQAMWQEVRQNYQSGAYGDPTALETRILFWSMMEDQHYPGATAARTFLEEQASNAAQQAAMMQAQSSPVPTSTVPEMASPEQERGWQ